MPGVIVERSIELLSNLEPKLLALKKYESNFSPEATQLLNVAISSISKHKALVVGWPSGPGLSAYLLTGAKTDELKKSLIESQHAVTGLMSGSMPLPRSAKEDLQNLRNELLGLKMDSSAEQTEVVKRLQTLYVDLTDKSKEADVDAIEEKLDDVMRQVLQNVFGSTSLPDEELKIELNALELSVESAKAGSGSNDAAVLSLALNSMQRLHASQLKSEEEEEEEEEEEFNTEDEEDPFYMPMPLAALKMAEASKFSMLAQPLSPADAKPFMISMASEEDVASTAAPGMVLDANSFEESPGLTAQDFEPVLDARTNSGTGACTGAGAAAAAAGLVGGALAGVAAAAAIAANSGRETVSHTITMANGGEGGAAGGGGAGTVSSPSPSEEAGGAGAAAGSATSPSPSDAGVTSVPTGTWKGAVDMAEEAGIAADRSADRSADRAAAAAAGARPNVPAAAAAGAAIGSAEGAPGACPGLPAAAASGAAAGATATAAATAADIAAGGGDISVAGGEVAHMRTAAATKPALTVDPAATETTESTSGGEMVVAGSTGGTGEEVASPGQEKLHQFVNFLQGENPGACMFHAQMRLSFDGCQKLANFLKSSQRVRALSLSHNYLGDEGLAVICEGLRQNKSVTALDLPDNNITDVGVATLVKAVANNPSLTQVQLAYNRIGNEGAVALAELIRSNCNLKKLGLSFNNIGKAGCQALTSAIASNHSLKHLQILPGNPVEEKDAKHLAKALKHNKKFSIRSFLGME